MDDKKSVRNVLQRIGQRVLDWAEEGQPQEDDYSDVFGRPKAPEGSREAPFDILKFDDITNFYYNITEQYKDKGIKKSVLELEGPETVGGRPIYLVRQTFTDAQGNTIKKGSQFVGRIFYARSLDKRLENSFERANPFEL